MSFDIVVADWLMGTDGRAGSLGTGDALRVAISALARKSHHWEGPWAKVDQQEQDRRLLALAKGREVAAFLATPRTAVYVCRRDGFILWASENFAEVFGHRAEDLVGRNAWEIFPDKGEDLKQGAEASARLNEGDIAVWLRLKLASGEKDWFRLDALNREGGVLLAFRREVDPARRRFHFVPRT